MCALLFTMHVLKCLYDTELVCAFQYRGQILWL